MKNSPVSHSLIALCKMTAAAFALAAMSGLAHAQSAPVHSVLELFTSQGCSSCPPADRLAGELKDEEGVLVLSYNVDYWDYLGWRDTFANPEFSERQREYARGRGDRQVYTPQIVVNGHDHYVGSRKGALGASIALNERLDDSLPVPVEVDQTPEVMTIRVGAAAPGTGRSGTVYVVVFTRDAEVEIGRGENGGRSVTYHNVVRKLIPVGMWTGKAMELSLPRSAGSKQKGDGCAVFVQTKRGDHPGDIIGAAIVSTGKVGV